MNIKIKRMSLRGGQPRRNGIEKVAGFDCQIGPLTLYGCAILRTTSGSLTVMPPEAKSGRDGMRSIWISDDGVRDDFRAAALAAYRDRGGGLGDEESVDAGLRRVLCSDMEDALKQVAA